MYSKIFIFWVVNDPFVPKRRDIYLQSNSYLAYIWQALLIHWSTHLASVIQNEILCPLADLRAAFGEHTLFASRGGGQTTLPRGALRPLSAAKSLPPIFYTCRLVETCYLSSWTQNTPAVNSKTLTRYHLSLVAQHVTSSVEKKNFWMIKLFKPLPKHNQSRAPQMELGWNHLRPSSGPPHTKLGSVTSD